MKPIIGLLPLVLLVESAAAFSCKFKIYMNDKDISKPEMTFKSRCDNLWKDISVRAYLLQNGVEVPGSSRLAQKTRSFSTKAHWETFVFTPSPITTRKNLAFCVRYVISDSTGRNLPEDGGCGTPAEAEKENGGQMSCNGCVNYGDYFKGYYSYGQFSYDPAYYNPGSDPDFVDDDLRIPGPKA